MKKAGWVVLGGLLLLGAVAVQAARLVWDNPPPWMGPAAVVTTWMFLLGGSFLIASTRSRRDHDSS